MSDSTSQRPYIGVATLVWDRGKLLLGKRINEDGSLCWQFPGGRLEYSEDVLDCARREVLEEAGVAIHQLKPVGYNKDVFIDHGHHYVTLFVSAKLQYGVPEVREPDKCLGWQWFMPDDLPSPLFAPIIHLMKAHPDLSDLA